MSERTPHPMIKPALEFGPLIAFFIGYMMLRNETFLIGGTEYGGFIVVTAAFVPLMVLSTGLLWWLTGHLSRMQVMSVALVVIFGGMSVWLNDERFFKIKPTIIYLMFAAILGIGLLRGQSWLQFVMEGVMPLQPAGWMILTRRLALFFVALALTNELVWRTMSTAAWVNFKTFGLTLAMFAFFMAQSRLMQTYGTKEGE